jgi:M6 family metalloprotease-like protein
MRSWLRLAFGAVVLAALPCFAVAVDPTLDPDLTEYRTVEQATKARLAASDISTLPAHPYLGVEAANGANGKVLVQEVAVDSPAAKAGVKRGDELLAFDGTPLKDARTLAGLLDQKYPGETVRVTVGRGALDVELKVKLTALSRPVPQGRQQPSLGLLAVKGKDGVVIEQVAPGSPADRASLKVGDLLLELDSAALPTPEKFHDLLNARKPGDEITLKVQQGGKAVEKKVIVGAELVTEKKGGSFDNRFNIWKKPVYHLAVICIEYPDEKHNAKVTSKDWEDSLYTTGTYTKVNATGQQVFGSLNDFYLEQSYKKIKIEGKCFDFVQVAKNRTDYATGPNRMSLFTEAVDKLLARDGKDALDKFDGVFFLYAGTRPQGTQRGNGSIYWPHRGTFTYNGKRWPYFICPEGGQRMANISVFCHEFGHMLGLPDLYARPEAPNIIGLGQWCLMSNQVGNGRPQHASAWCKEKLGWIEPCLIDPTVKQKLILAPIEDSPKECYKVLIHRDGSEYLLLENRAKKGFDKSLAGEGLLIWRVVRGQPVLEESHGVEGQSGPNVFLPQVPYPSAANDSFTPYTTPSSRSKLGGGLPVYLTNIRRLSDGRITVHIGYEYQ